MPSDNQENFQARVDQWVNACLGRAVAVDKRERIFRFLEEALELAQAGGCTQAEAVKLVDYVFARPVGEFPQELGGTLTTLAAVAQAHDLDMMQAGETELARMWVKFDDIRAKHATKPRFSPLPGTAPAGTRRAAGLYLQAREQMLAGTLLDGGYSWVPTEGDAGRITILHHGVAVIWFDVDYWNRIQAGTDRATLVIDGYHRDITEMLLNIPEWKA